MDFYDNLTGKPNVKKYGQRAKDSRMGDFGKPITAADIRDVLEEGVSLFEIPGSDETVHHLDLTKEDISDGVGLFIEIAEKRGKDISLQLDLLQTRTDPGKRRVAVKWILELLFDEQSVR